MQVIDAIDGVRQKGYFWHWPISVEKDGHFVCEVLNGLFLEHSFSFPLILENYYGIELVYLCRVHSNRISKDRLGIRLPLGWGAIKSRKKRAKCYAGGYARVSGKREHFTWQGFVRIERDFLV